VKHLKARLFVAIVPVAVVVSLLGAGFADGR
jgi:hypothetical protein